MSGCSELICAFRATAVKLSAKRVVEMGGRLREHGRREAEELEWPNPL